MASRSPRREFDIAIIGGGVAGSSAAITLQNMGYASVLVEREPRFRDRVRGEACHPWGVRELMALDLKRFVDDIGGLELPVWTRYENRLPEEPFSWADAFKGSPPEIGFNHAELQTALLQGAITSGVTVCQPARADIARSHDGWMLSIETADGSVAACAGFLIAADGKTSSTRRLWGAEPDIDEQHHAFGGMLVRGIRLPDHSAHQGFHASGFSMLFPQGNDRWRVYYVCPTEVGATFVGDDRVERYLEACAACYPEGAFADAEPAGPLAFFPNSHQGCTRINGPLAVAIGDAAGAPDPSQGHGMSLVWRDVRVLRDLFQSVEFSEIPAEFARQRSAYEAVLRTHARWVEVLTTETSDEAMARRAQVETARAADPSALGYAALFALGPDGLPTDDDARSRFFGEHLAPNPVSLLEMLDK